MPRRVLVLSFAVLVTAAALCAHGDEPPPAVLRVGRDGTSVTLVDARQCARWTFVLEVALDPLDERAKAKLARWGAGLVFVDTGATLYALDQATGTLKWRFDAPKLGAFNAVSQVCTDGERAYVTCNTFGSRLACLDLASGRVRWQFPTDGRELGWYGMALHAGLLVVNTARSDGSGHYTYDCYVALDPATGALRPVPAGHPTPLVPSGPRPLGVMVEGEHLFPRMVDYDPAQLGGAWDVLDPRNAVAAGQKWLVGELARTDRGFELARPPRYVGPSYTFSKHAAEQLEPLVGQRVEIRAIVREVLERGLPIYRLEIVAVRKAR